MDNTKKRFVIIIILICFICVLLTTAFGYLFSKNQLEEKEINRNMLLASTTAETINSWLTDKSGRLDSICRSLEIKNDFDYEHMQQYMNQLKDVFDEKELVDLYFTYPDNRMACAFGYETDGTIQYVQRPWYKEPILTGEICFESPYRDLDTGNYIITVSKAIYTDGKLQGVMAVDTYANSIVTVTDKTALPDDSYAMLIDDSMGIITHPKNEDLYKDDIYTTLYMFENGAYDELIELLEDDSMHNRWIRDYDGMERMMFTSQVEKGNLHVVIAIEKSQWQAEYLEMLRTYVIAVILLCLALVLISIRAFSTALIKPVQRAEEASRAKSQFLSSMSNEIRTPINAIIGLNDLILRDSKDEQITQYSISIKQAGKTLLAIINNVLNMSKIEAGKLDVQPVEYSMRVIARELFENYKPLADAKDIDLEIKVSDNFPRKIVGDDLKIKELFNNIISNGIKYTQEGSVKVNIGCEVLSDDEIMLKAVITDTGIGIKEEDIPKMTQSFERIELDRNRNIEGTGLGMSIVVNLLNMMHGDLHINSKYGQGTEVTFELPQTIIDIDTTEPVEMDIDKIRKDMNRVPFTAPGAKILVVDDKDINCIVVKKQLEPIGAQVDMAFSGPQCIDMCRQTQYDLILMDHMMPGMDGVQTLNRLKEEECKATIVALTANAIGGAREAYISYGFDGYISKPIEIRELQNAVEEFLPGELIMREGGMQS